MTLEKVNCGGHIVIVATVPSAIKSFLTSHVRSLGNEYKITLLSNGKSNSLELLLKLKNVTFHSIRIERKIFPVQDFVSLLRLWQKFRSTKPDLVLSITPKAGLLSMLGGRLAGVPGRLHIFTGQVWATKRGVIRYVLKMADRIIASCATHILADSSSQRNFLITEKVVDAERIRVLANGSICGVDTELFRPDVKIREEMRQELGIPAEGLVFLYLGRLNRDKGVPELARAFARLAAINNDVWLILVGPDEEGMQEVVRVTCRSFLDRLRITGYTSLPERFMAMADVLCLPSYREGFGSVIIEAAACGVPAVASRIYGITDAVVEGETGLLFPVGDEEQLFDRMATFASNSGLLRKMGGAAKARALQNFSATTITDAMGTYIENIFNKSDQNN